MDSRADTHGSWDPLSPQEKRELWELRDSFPVPSDHIYWRSWSDLTQNAAPQHRSEWGLAPPYRGPVLEFSPPDAEPHPTFQGHPSNGEARQTLRKPGGATLAESGIHKEHDSPPPRQHTTDVRRKKNKVTRPEHPHQK
jgi:hypothetical protein